MQEYDCKNKSTTFSVTTCGQMNKAVIWDLAKEFHVGRNTVANIAKELSIQFKYETLQGKIRAYVYNDEAERIRQVLDEKHNVH